MSESEDENGRKKIKRLPGEAREQAFERYKKEKDLRRLRKLMKYAYPRAQEMHTLKKKLMPRPEEYNSS